MVFVKQVKGMNLTIHKKSIQFLTGLFVGTLCLHVLANVSRRPAREALATRVQKILGMKTGNHSYLPQYRKIIRFMKTNQTGNVNKAWKDVMAQPPVRRAIHSLVGALNAGANAIALRNKILASLTLNGYMEKPGSPWGYGTPVERWFIWSYLSARSINMLHKGENVRATKYARAGILLRCQDAPSLGVGTVLNGWFNPSSSFARQNAIALHITPLQRARLLKIYWPAVHYEMRFISIKRPFLATHLAIVKMEHGYHVLPKKLVGNYVATMKATFRKLKRHIFLEYFYLRIIRGDVRTMIGHGHRRAARRIRVALKSLEDRIKKQKNISIIDSQALLRWIKEAQERW